MNQCWDSKFGALACWLHWVKALPRTLWLSALLSPASLLPQHVLWSSPISLKIDPPKRDSALADFLSGTLTNQGRLTHAETEGGHHVQTLSWAITHSSENCFPTISLTWQTLYLQNKTTLFTMHSLPLPSCNTCHLLLEATCPIPFCSSRCYKNSTIWPFSESHD